MSNVNFADYYQPKPKQLFAHLCPDKYLLFGGAMGGGKSWFLMGEAIVQAMRYPGNRILIVRETLAVLKDTTFVTFLKICPPELLIGGKPNMSNYEARFVNGSIIRFKGVDIRKDPLLQNLKGWEIGWAGMDEANEMPKAVFDILKARLRWVCPDGTVPAYQIRLTSNPESCWLKTIFIEKNLINHTFIQSLTTDNYSTDSDYIKKLESAYSDNPEMLRRYLEGSWEDSDAANNLFTTDVKRLLFTNKPAVQYPYYSLGVDVARFGVDRSVFVTINGGYIINIDIFAKTSIPDVYRKTMEIATRHKISGDRVGVDTVGLGGGVADMAKESGLKVEEIVGGASGKDTLRETMVQPYNLRAAMFIALQLDIKSGDLAFGDTLSGELKEAVITELGMIRYDFASEMRWRIMKKEDIKKQFGISPDIVDALAYANWVRRKKIKTAPAALPFFGGTVKRK